jgi:hypothetical protein
MKEVFTKGFWQLVKKTFDEALEDPPPTKKSLETRAEGDRMTSSTAETPSPSATQSSPSVANGSNVATP